MNSATTCRVCRSPRVHAVGHVEYLEGFDYPVYDCDGCGCRWTRHDSSVHERLHAVRTISYYQSYADLAERCRGYFAGGDLASLQGELAQLRKYRFIIDRLSRLPRSASILEVGCSRGYLTAWSILDGRRILGVDVSPDAIAGARSAFGDHFAVAHTPEATQGAPYDVIYHVGLIGCVGDPLGLTRDLLQQLKPGGMLLFNAPNRGALATPRQLWFDSAPPPDLVTLFPEGFWKAQFNDGTAVEEIADLQGDREAVGTVARKMVGLRWQPPVPQPPSVRAHIWSQPSRGIRPLLARAISRAIRTAGAAALVPKRPAEFGLFVEMARG